MFGKKFVYLYNYVTLILKCITLLTTCIYVPVDGFSNIQDMFDLEKDLPDELMGWEQPGVMGPKPPAQGPGPGGQMSQQQMNGDDPTAAMQRQINNHLMQQVSVVL